MHRSSHIASQSRSFRLRAVVACLLLVLGAASVANAQPMHDALWAEATLYRDEWGVPHVQASTPRGLGFAFGYAQAEDHLESMLMAYRICNGRAAEVLGESMAPSDEFSIRMGHARLARQALERLAPDTAALCTGFAMGVNAYLVDHEDRAPAWADGVQPWDPLALWHAFVTSFAPLDLPGVERPARAMETGNTWAMAPSRMQEGKTALVINPHGYFEGPFRWYEAHLALGDLDVYGATLFGLPVIVQGFNDSVGWSLTPNRADFADVFQEQIQPQGGGGNPKDPRFSAAAVEVSPTLAYYASAQPYYVRTADGMQERAAPSYIHSRGPVFESGGTLFSWTIGGFGDFGGFDQLLAMGRARDLDTFQQALAMQQIPCFHVVYADREGNLFYLYNAKTGNRAVQFAPGDESQAAQEGINWSAPVSWGYHGMAWQNIVPIDGLPNVLNPGAGFVQACGGAPWGATDDSGIDAGAYPPWFVNEGDSFRARRVRQLLRAGARSFPDMHSMIFDAVAPAAVEMAPLLLEMAEADAGRVGVSHPDLATGLELLRNWNYTAETGSRAMAFYHVWWAMLTARAQGELPNEYAIYDALAAKTPAAVEAALGAANDAARLMRNDLNAIEVPWGEVHRLRRGGEDRAVPGSVTGEPIFVAGDYAYGDGKWHANYGYGVAIAVQFGDTPEAYSVAPFGSSEDPRSPHYADQMDLLLEKRLKRARYTNEDVLRFARQARGRHFNLFPLGTPGAVTFHSDTLIEARLAVSVDAPAVLPDGLVSFTTFIRPEITAGDPAAAVGLSLGIAPESCDDSQVDLLRVFVHIGEGWRALDDAARDATGRGFMVVGSAGFTYAVLGPASALPGTGGDDDDNATPSAPALPVWEAPIEAQSPAALPDAPLVESTSKESETPEMIQGGYASPEEIGAALDRIKTEVTPRGTRVIRLRGGDIDGNLESDRVMYMEGLPADSPFPSQPQATTAPSPTQEAGPPAQQPAPSGRGEVKWMEGNPLLVEQGITVAPQAPATPRGPVSTEDIPQVGAPEAQIDDDGESGKSRRERRREREEAEEKAKRGTQIIEIRGEQSGASVSFEASPGDGWADAGREEPQKKRRWFRRD